MDKDNSQKHLEGFASLSDNLSSAHAKIKLVLNPFGEAAKIARNLNGALAYQTKIRDYFQVTNSIKELLAPNRAILEISSHSQKIRNTFLASDYLAKTLRPFQLVQNNFSLVNQSFLLSAHGTSAIKALDYLKSHSVSYEKQQHIIKQFSSVLNSQHAVVKAMSMSTSSLNYNDISSFHLLGALSLKNILINESSEESANESLDVISQVLDENSELKSQIEILIKKVDKLKREAKRSRNDDVQLKGILEQITYFIHKWLFSGGTFSTQQIYSFMQVLFLILAVVYDSGMEYKGGEVFQYVFGNEEKAPMQAVENNYEMNSQPASYLHTHSINNVSLYLRPSEKTKKLGRLLTNSGVLIISQKPNWCFVEALVHVKDKKGIVLDKVLRGWVKKNSLEYFK